jgi:hypothetical protein
MNTFADLSAKQLRQAAQLKERIDSLEAELARILGASTVSMTAAPARRKLSAAAIAKIRAGQKARWARVKSLGSARKPRRKMSAAAKARLAAIARARWKQAKAQGKTAL